jgi:prepilin-type N-terminal cleavage/methylation domain-containing protein
MKRVKGFTLIEVIVSIALIGIILVGILPVMAQGLIFLNKTKEITQDVFSAQQMMELAIESAKDHTSGLTPKSVTLFPGYDIVVPYYEVVNVYENKKYVTMVSEARPAEYEALNLTGVKAIANNDVTLKVVPSSSGNQIDGEHDIVTHPDFYRNIYQWYISKPGYNMPYPATQIPEAEVGTIYPVFPYDYQALPLGYDVKRLSDLSAFSGRHVVFSATPASIKGKLGPLVSSNPILVVGYPDIANLLLHLDASLIDESNASEVTQNGSDILLKSWVNQVDKTNNIQGAQNERPKVMTNPPKTDFIGKYADFDADKLMSIAGFNALQNKSLYVFAVVRGNENGIINHNGQVLNATDPAEGVTDNNIIQLGNGWKIAMTQYTSTNNSNYKKMTIGAKNIDMAEVMVFHDLTSDDIDDVIAYLKNKYKIYVPVTDIVDLHNIEHEVFRGDVYALPSSVLATFLDGTTRYVAVTWPDLTYAPGGIVDTSAVRTILYTGQSVDSPAEKVTLRVKIKPVLIFDSLSIDAITQPLAIGDHPVLTYAYTPVLGTVESVKWQSSKPSVATIGVSSGEVMAISNGKTTITLTINNVNVATYELTIGTSGLPYSDGLVLHLSSSDAANFEIASGAVSKWLDLSGENNDFVQNTSNRRPQLVDGLLQFASNDYLEKSGKLSGVGFFTNDGSDFTTFIVAKSSEPSSGWGTYLSNYMSTSTSYLFGRSEYDSFEHVINNNSNTLEHDENDDLNLFSSTNASGTLSSWLNGMDKVSRTYSKGAQNSSKIFIGAGYGGASNYLNGSVAEVVVFDHALTDAQRQSIEAYLYEKWLYVPQTYLAEWTFNDSLESWTGTNIDNLNVMGGKLTGILTTDTSSHIQISGLNLDVNESSKIEISLKNASSATSLKIAFKNDNNANFSDSRSKTFTISANDTAFKTYVFDLSTIGSWANRNLEDLRIYPLMNADDETFEIDVIKITE